MDSIFPKSNLHFPNGKVFKLFQIQSIFQNLYIKFIGSAVKFQENSCRYVQSHLPQPDDSLL